MFFLLLQLLIVGLQCNESATLSLRLKMKKVQSISFEQLRPILIPTSMNNDLIENGIFLVHLSCNGADAGCVRIEPVDSDCFILTHTELGTKCQMPYTLISGTNNKEIPSDGIFFRLDPNQGSPPTNMSLSMGIKIKKNALQENVAGNYTSTIRISIDTET